MNAREAAYLSLKRCEKEGRYSNLEIDTALKKYKFSPQDRGLFTTLVYGVIERRITLDYILGLYSKQPVEELEEEMRGALRLGAYQVLYLDRVPDSAACNETVELVKSVCRSRGAASYANGVLRTLIRQKDAIPYPDPHREPVRYLSVYYGCPEWLCSLWRKDYGAAKAEKILGALTEHPTVTLRANTLKISRDDLLCEMTAAGIAAEPTRYAGGIRLLERVAPASLPWLSDGRCFVQDEASQLCAAMLEAAPGDFVIDTCACPGGKSFSAAIGMENRGRVLSMDLHENKLSLVRRGAEALGITILETGVQNGTQYRPDLDGSADRVLCDVPCSGLGVIAKKPEIRYKDPAEIARLPEVQYAILENGSRYVRPGGVLLYSTCTLRRAENEEVAERFAAAHPSFEKETFRTFFPDSDGTDGFFCARFRKKKH